MRLPWQKSSFAGNAPPPAALLVVGALALTAGAAVAGKRSPAEDPLARADARLTQELGALGLETPQGGDFGAACSSFADATAIAPLFARRSFRLEAANGAVEGDAMDDARGRRALEVIREEVARYPAEVLAQAFKVRRIIVAADLREGGKLISSLPNVNGSLLLDGAVPDGFLRRLVHHELFHFLDFHDDTRNAENAAWSAENGLCAYGDGGRTVRMARASELSDELPGFLNRYSLSGVEEDKAEVFSFLMTAPSEVQARAARDGVVRAKVRRLGEKLGRIVPDLAPVTSFAR